MGDWSLSVPSTPRNPRPRVISRLTLPTRARFYDHGKWQHPYHFALMLLISSTIIPQFTEFPSRTFDHGGLAFFVIYMLIFFGFGLPMVVLECQLGQYFGQSCIKIIRHICPVAGGIGILQLLTIYLELMKNHLTMNFVINYLFSSVVFTSPWRVCGHQWSSKNCYTKEQDDHCLKSNSYFWNNTCYDAKRVCKALKMIYFNYTHCLSHNKRTYIPDVLSPSRTTPGQEYFNFLANSEFTVTLVAGLYFVINYILAWGLSNISVYKGLNKTGVQVAHVLFFTENLILIFLCVTAIVSSGGLDGVLYGFKFDWASFTNHETWFFAFKEVFENLNIGFAINTVLASFNHFDADLIQPIFYSGICQFVFNQLIYSVNMYALWGVASLRTGKSLKYFSTHASGNFAVLIMFPDLYLQHKTPQFWSTLFFIIIILRTTGANFIALETLVISLGDIFVFPRRHPKIFRLLLSILICCSGFCFAISEPFRIIVLLFRAVSFDYELTTLIEIILFGVIYGMKSGHKNRNFDDLYKMVGWNSYVYLYLLVVYYYVAPLVAVFYVVSKFLTFEFEKNFIEFAFQVIYIAKSPIFLLLYGFVIVYRVIRKGQSIKSTMMPTPNWYPQPYTSKSVYEPHSSFGPIKAKVALLLDKMSINM